MTRWFTSSLLLALVTSTAMGQPHPSAPTMEVVASSQQPAPGGGMFEGTFDGRRAFLDLRINAGGVVCFVASLGHRQNGVFTGRPGNLRCVARGGEGQTFTAGQGGSPSLNRLALDDAGAVYYWATVNGGPRGFYRSAASRTTLVAGTLAKQDVPIWKRPEDGIVLSNGTVLLRCVRAGDRFPSINRWAENAWAELLAGQQTAAGLPTGITLSRRLTLKKWAAAGNQLLLATGLEGPGVRGAQAVLHWQQRGTLLATTLGLDGMVAYNGLRAVHVNDSGHYLISTKGPGRTPVRWWNGSLGDLTEVVFTDTVPTGDQCMVLSDGRLLFWDKRNIWLGHQHAVAPIQLPNAHAFTVEAVSPAGVILATTHTPTEMSRTGRSKSRSGSKTIWVGPADGLRQVVSEGDRIQLEDGSFRQIEPGSIRISKPGKGAMLPINDRGEFVFSATFAALPGRSDQSSVVLRGRGWNPQPEP